MILQLSLVEYGMILQLR